MPNHDRCLSAVAEAEWHVTAAECRLLLAIRDCTSAEVGLSACEVDGLIDDLGQALARLQFALHEGAPRSTGETAAAARGRRNGSFTASRHCHER